MKPISADVVWVIEDDPKIAGVIVDYLTHAGFSAESIGDGAVALKRLREGEPSLLILDVMLPGLDGMELCRAIRTFSKIPVIFLTARVDEVDRLLGLDLGADDYVCKPFSPSELVARVRAQLRRASGQLLSTGSPWDIDDETIQIRWRGKTLPLTVHEFRLLRLMLEHPGRVFSRSQLLDAIQTELRDVSDRSIDSHVKNIRKKLVAISPESDRIETVYGAGYRIDVGA